MFNTRLVNYLQSSDYSSRISSETRERLPASPSMSFPVSFSDIYRSAYETAKRDYELNRLFNPHYYDDGGGI